MIAILTTLLLVSSISTVERPICVPKGTCLPDLPDSGEIDVRILVPDDIEKCPKENIKCTQKSQAVTCGYTYRTSTENGPARYGSHPWLAYITNQTGFTGSGVLLNRWNVLTAAHKVFQNRYSLQMLTVYIGVHNINSLPDAYKRFVENIKIHPEFDPVTLRNDLAVLSLKAHIPLGYMKTVGAACLPRSDDNFIGKRCVVAGWGATQFDSPNIPVDRLRQAIVPIVSYQKCYASMRTVLGIQTDQYLDRYGEICAGGEQDIDSCTNDGGAPLMCIDNNGKKVVAGLVIWGLKCGEPNKFGVYVDVPKYVDWINQSIQDLQT